MKNAISGMFLYRLPLDFFVTCNLLLCREVFKQGAVTKTASSEGKEKGQETKYSDLSLMVTPRGLNSNQIILDLHKINALREIL